MERSNRSIGDMGEEAVTHFLRKNGYEILERNYTRKGGEIDIIAYKNDTLVFVEVKTRKLGAQVSGKQAVNTSKRKNIIRTARLYSSEFSRLHGETSGRFDIACVDTANGEVVHMDYCVGAFDASGS